MKSPKDGCRIFNNLAEDEELFGASGDYQFDIYRWENSLKVAIDAREHFKFGSMIF